MTRRAKRLPVALSLSVAVLSVACAGPKAPIDIGAKNVPIDLLLGRKVQKVAQAPVPPLLLPVPPRFGPFVIGPSGPGSAPEAPAPTPTTQPPGPCPEADPLAVPVDVAENNIPGPPKASAFEYRTQGELKTGGANASDVVLAPTSKVTVSPPQAEPTGGFTFTVTVENQMAPVTTTTYRVLPTGASADVPRVPPPTAPTGQPVDPPRPTGVPAGLYLAQVEQSGDAVPFRPQFPGIPIVRLPLDIGTSFDATGSDGITTVSWRSTLVGKAHIDACGTLLDSYVVELTNGRITSGEDAEDVSFSSKMNIGPQFGGLLLHVATVADGTAGTVAVHRSVTMTINSKPEPA